MASQPTGSTDPTSTPGVWTEDTLDIDAWSDLHPGRSGKQGAVQRDEGYWTTTDYQQLYWQTWFDDASDEPRRGTVALMHGYGEHSARYDHVAIALVRSGYDVMAIDARGHGRSTGRRGYVEHFSRYVDDLSMLKRRALARWPDRPLFLFGHSNGGLIALRYALRKPDGITGFVVSSPLCGLAVEVPLIKDLAGRLTSRIWPTLSLPSELDPEMVSHVDEVVEKYRRDPLIFDTANARWFTETQNAQRDLKQRADALDQPFLFLVAGDDNIVCSETTESLFHRLASLDRELEIYPDLYHEILNERSWPVILRRIILWMERHRNPTSK